MQKGGARLGGKAEDCLPQAGAPSVNRPPING